MRTVNLFNFYSNYTLTSARRVNVFILGIHSRGKIKNNKKEQQNSKGWMLVEQQ
jgi:hypothetical protein